MHPPSNVGIFEFFMLNLIRADVPTLFKMIVEKTKIGVGIEPRPLAQDSESILTELT